MSGGQNLERCVQMLQDAMNRHDIDAILQMFTDDALFEIDARPPWVGHAQIREILEYDAAVHGKLRFINCISEGDIVTGELLEQNDRLAAIGIETLRYSSCRLAFHEGRIQRFSAVREAAGAQRSRDAWTPFLPWLAAHYPADRVRLFTPEGRFIQNRENGARVVLLLREWREGQREERGAQHKAGDDG